MTVIPPVFHKYPLVNFKGGYFTEELSYLRAIKYYDIFQRM